MTKKQAIKLYKSKFWEKMSDYDKVKFQLFENRLCMPFEIFHAAIEKVLKRPIWTHEFASSNIENIRKEFLGEKPAPSMQEIIELIPEANRIIFVTK